MSIVVYCSLGGLYASDCLGWGTADHRKVLPFSPAPATPAARGPEKLKATAEVLGPKGGKPAAPGPTVLPSPKAESRGISFDFSGGEEDEWGARSPDSDSADERDARRPKKGRKEGKRAGRKVSPKSPKAHKGKAKARQQPVHKARKATRQDEEDEDDGSASLAGLPYFLGMTATTAFWRTEGVPGSPLRTRPSQDADGEGEGEEEGEEGEEEGPGSVKPSRLDVDDPIKTLRAIWADGQEEEEEEGVYEGDAEEEGQEEEEEEGEEGSVMKHTHDDDSEDEEEEDDMLDQPLGELTIRESPRAGSPRR